MTTVKPLVFLLAAGLLLNFWQASPVFSLGPKKSAAAAQAENMEIRDKWAILVGINRFSDTAIPTLKFAQKSSADLARAIKDPDYGHFAQNHVLVLNGPDASKAALEQSFNEWLYKKAMPDDLVIIYFNTRLLKNAAGDAVICANDTQVKDLEKTGVNLSELLTNARQRVGSTHMLCLLDTNPVSEISEKPAHDLKWLAKSTGMAVFSAAELFKPSLDDAGDMQSYFIHFFVEALKTGGGNYPMAMVAEYVWQKLQETSKSTSASGQTAVLCLASEQSGTIAIPVGIMVRSSMPPKTLAVGHPLDTLAFDRPDMVAPTMNPAKSSIRLQSRNRGLPVAVAAASRPNFVAVAPLSGTHTAAKTPASNAAPAQSSDEDDDSVDPNLDMRPYVAKIKQDIQKKWQLPKGLESRRVTTTFSIMRDGKISNAAIVESSGNTAVDESALAALQSASPLEPLPKGAPESVDIKYVFDWKTKLGSQ